MASYKTKSVVLKINISEWVLWPSKGNEQKKGNAKINVYFFLCFKLSIIKTK